MKKIPSLDGIRALSFLLVFVAHTGLEQSVPGGLGVTIFFFLSGFLITTLMREEYDKTGSLNLRHFWIRRALRIFPPFYIVLIGAALVSSVKLGPVLAQIFNVTNYWVIYHGYDGMPLGTGVYWSLSVEEHFYLMFPWVFIALQRLKWRDQIFILYGACALVLAWRCALVMHFHVATDRTYMGTDTRIDSIIFGSALAVWNVEKRKLIELRWAAYTTAAALLLGGCLVVRSEEFRETMRYTLQGISLTVLFIAAVRFPKWAPMRVLNTRILEFIGLLSYSLYLLHYAVIFAVQAVVPNKIVAAVLAFGLSMGCSYIIYLLVEKPCARMRHRLSKRDMPGQQHS